jgi:hypothetical protein
MDSSIRKDVARRVWIILCGFETCTCVCISAINVTTAITFLKLSRLQNTVDMAINPGVPDLLLIVFGLGFFELSTFWCPTLCWRWACQTRLQMFSVIGFLADAVWALVIVALLRPGFCISPDSCCCGEYRIIHHLQVSLECCQRLISLIKTRVALIALATATFFVSFLALIVSTAYFRETCYAFHLYSPRVCSWDTGHESGELEVEKKADLISVHAANPVLPPTIPSLVKLSISATRHGKLKFCLSRVCSVTENDTGRIHF